MATVNASGLVKAVELGTSIITANMGGVSGGVSMVVKAGPGQESVIYTFAKTSSVDGLLPQAPPIQASDGDFYGTTSSGGPNSCFGMSNACGTVYKLTPAGIESILYSFGASASDGHWPDGSLIQTANGTFYGTTSRGGVYDDGTVFKITSDGAETILYSFGASPSDGAVPSGGLILANDGNFYGITTNGGANSCYSVPHYCGTVFRITPSGTETVIYSFGASPSDGYNPTGALIQASDGNVYGTTSDGGAYTYLGVNGPQGGGTVFKLTLSGLETVVYSFGAEDSGGIALDGFTPQGTLIQDNSGNLYGTTAAGGTNINYVNPNITNGCGTLFKITPSGAETVIYSFGASETDGCIPYGPIVEAADGNFYGTTRWGGSWGANAPWAGIAFQITPAGVETILHVFGSVSDGGDPQGLMQATDGNFYGPTEEYFPNSLGLAPTGTIFKLVP